MEEPSGPSSRGVQAVLAAGPEQHVVVGGRGLQLVGRQQVPDVHQAAVGQQPEARYAFVGGVVVLEVVALLVFAALPAAVGPDEEHPDVVEGAFADDEVVSGQAAGLVDEGRGGRPAGIVEHGVVQRRHDAFERVLLAHDGSRLLHGVGTDPTLVRHAVPRSPGRSPHGIPGVLVRLPTGSRVRRSPRIYGDAFCIRNRMVVESRSTARQHP